MIKRIEGFTPDMELHVYGSGLIVVQNAPAWPDDMERTLEQDRINLEFLQQAPELYEAHWKMLELLRESQGTMHEEKAKDWNLRVMKLLTELEG